MKRLIGRRQYMIVCVGVGIDVDDEYAMAAGG